MDFCPLSSTAGLIESLPASPHLSPPPKRTRHLDEPNCRREQELRKTITKGHQNAPHHRKKHPHHSHHHTHHHHHHDHRHCLDVHARDSSSCEASVIYSCPLIFMLPRDVWRMNICSYLSHQDLARLRSLCQWFRKEIVVYPVWRQSILIEHLQEYLDTCLRLSWTSELHCCRLSQDLSPALLSALPSNLCELDLSKCLNPITEEHIPWLPRSLNRLILSWLTTNLGKKFFEDLLNAIPDLTVEFNDYGSLFGLMFWACANGSFETVKFLLERKKIRQTMDQGNGDYGVTALYAACLNGFKDIVELLLQSGAQVDKARAMDGRTPLIISTTCGHAEIVAILIRYGADVNYKDQNGKMALDYADQNQALKELLLRKTKI